MRSTANRVVLLRPHGLHPVTVLGKKFTDFFSQDLITGRAQMDLIADKERLDRLAILAQHVRTDVDIFGLGLGLEIVAD